MTRGSCHTPEARVPTSFPQRQLVLGGAGGAVWEVMRVH